MVAPSMKRVPSCRHALRTAATSACAVGSTSRTSVFTPVASTVPSRTTTAPKGSCPAAALSKASCTACASQIVTAPRYFGIRHHRPSDSSSPVIPSTRLTAPLAARNRNPMPAAVASVRAAASTWMPVESMNGTPPRSISIIDGRRPSMSARSGPARDGAVSRSISPTTVTTAGSPLVTSTDSSLTEVLLEGDRDPTHQTRLQGLDVGRDRGDDPHPVTGLGEHVGLGQPVLRGRVPDLDHALGAVEVHVDVVLLAAAHVGHDVGAYLADDKSDIRAVAGINPVGAQIFVQLVPKLGHAVEIAREANGGLHPSRLVAASGPGISSDAHEPNG